MSYKYIPQLNNQNFIYPNNDLPEYDINIVHTIDDNSVSGTVTNFSATTVSSTGMTFSVGYTWSKNNAEPFISRSGNIHLMSVHMLAANQNYYKPWRCVNLVSSITTINTFYSGTTSFTVTPAQMGLSTFQYGNYYFEFRFIGAKAIYPVCYTYVPTGLPTPTPTATIGPTPDFPTVTPTSTPTPTPTATVTGSTYQSGATINVTETGYIKYIKKDAELATYVYISSLGTYTITDCVTCSSIMIGIPFADVANFTLLSCGSSC
jgi:hypothetical protein